MRKTSLHRDGGDRCPRDGRRLSRRSHRGTCRLLERQRVRRADERQHRAREMPGVLQDRRERSIRQTMRCASADYSINSLAELRVKGDQVTGSWEEKTYSAKGDVTGRFSGEGFVLSDPRRQLHRGHECRSLQLQAVASASRRRASRSHELRSRWPSASAVAAEAATTLKSLVASAHVADGLKVWDKASGTGAQPVGNSGEFPARTVGRAVSGESGTWISRDGFCSGGNRSGHAGPVFLRSKTSLP